MKRSFLFLFATLLAAQVRYERIANADSEPGSWLTYSHNSLGHRYSPLDQITPANVAGLKVKWAYQFPDARNEVSPIVAGLPSPSVDGPVPGSASRIPVTGRQNA